MRVNITHSVDLEEIPEHLLEMMNKKIDLDGLQELYRDICKNLNSNASSNTVGFCVEQIIEMRRILFKVDVTLQDCASILHTGLKKERWLSCHLI